MARITFDGLHTDKHTRALNVIDYEHVNKDGATTG